MIENIFGKEDNTIEVCSRSVRGTNEAASSSASACFTVDINPATKPDLVPDGQTLTGFPNNKFNRWRGDPPYNINKEYGTYKDSKRRIEFGLAARNSQTQLFDFER